MIIRVKMARSGLAEYLEKGKKKDSDYSRNEKDNVIPLYGNLDIFKKTELYLNKHKNYNYNYEHITLSFNKDDMLILDKLNDDERKEVLRSMTLDCIKHRVSGYDLDNEVISYAEVHQPIIKEENNKERLEHIHIGIAYYNPLNDTKLRTTFYNKNISDTIQAYINKKYGLTQPRDYKRDREGINADTQIAKDRKYYLEELKEIKSNKELIQYFKDNNINYREVKTKSNNYYKIINPQGKDINLKGKGFEHIHNMTIDKSFVYAEDKELKELEDTLQEYYKKRIEQIDNRRSRATKEAIKDIYNNDSIDIKEVNKIKSSYQEQLFYKHYKHLLDNEIDLKGYYIDISNNNEYTKFINKQKNINIEDKGDNIVSYSDDESTQESVRLMLNVAEAKGWDITDLEITGSKEFIEETERQVAERIKEKSNIKNTLSFTEKEAVEKVINTRPMTATQMYKKDLETKQEEHKQNNDISLTLLKQNLKAQRVLEYAVEKYKLNPNDYEITTDNKINNLNNKQKPKNVIDFLQKEVHLQTRQAIDICKDIYNNQPLEIKTQQDKREVNTMPMLLSICKDNNLNALNKWEQVEISNYTQLASYMKQYPYSQAIFDKGYRNSDNVTNFNNVLIYDIDNDKYTEQLTIKEVEQLLKEHNISAMIIPSRSHNKDKKVSSKVQKQAGLEPFEEYHKAERYRIVIPTNKALNTNDIKEFREFQRLTAHALKLDKYLDKQALNDKARFYYKSPIEAEPIIIKSDRVMNIDNLEQRAKENIQEQNRVKAEEEKRVKEIRSNLEQYRTVAATSSNNLTYADTQKMMNIDIKSLINHYEKDAKSYKEGSYDMIKTVSSKFSILEHNVAHDFKNDKTFNSLTYLQHKLGTTTINNVARYLESITGESYMQINYPRVKEVVSRASQKAINDKSLEQYIKQDFDVRYVKFEKDSIHIADKEIKLQELQLTRQELIKDLQRNREQQQKTRKPLQKQR